MKFFKKKPKPDIMGFLCCEISMKRADLMIEHFHDESLRLLTYGVSTAIIFKNLKSKYSDEMIAKCATFSDKFFMKKYKNVSKETFDSMRNEIYEQIKKNQLLEYFIKKANVEDCVFVEEQFDEWMNLPLLLDDNIKSM